jgi:hypothetical protein
MPLVVKKTPLTGRFSDQNPKDVVPGFGNSIGKTATGLSHNGLILWILFDEMASMALPDLRYLQPMKGICRKI